jgi:hypothetical protein
MTLRKIRFFNLCACSMNEITWAGKCYKTCRHASRFSCLIQSDILYIDSPLFKLLSHFITRGISKHVNTPFWVLQSHDVGHFFLIFFPETWPDLWRWEAFSSKMKVPTHPSNVIFALLFSFKKRCSYSKPGMCDHFVQCHESLMFVMTFCVGFWVLNMRDT